MTTTITLHRTECITFPRSGHHLLVRLLERYFGDAFVYCEMYEQPQRLLDVEPATNFQKNHDLELDTPLRDDRRHLVQVRSPIESIVSWFQQACESRQVADSPASWTNFAIQKSAFWMRFYRRWVLDPVPGRLIVNYADLIADPCGTLRQVAAFLTDEEPEPGEVEAACAAETIQRRSSLKSFRYYGPEFFDLLRGLFAAVPGVDVDTDALVLPRSQRRSNEDDELARAIEEVRRTSRQLEGIARRLTAAVND